jgi:hypothetical protein
MIENEVKNQFPGKDRSRPEQYKNKEVFWNGAFCAFEAQVELKSISLNKVWSFPAFVTSFRDNYTPNFESVNVFGRIDPIYTFTHTTRKIEIGMDIVSHHAAEAKQNWIELNEMAQGLYAVYNKMGSDDIIASPPIYGLKFHNLVREINTGGLLQDFVYGVLSGGVQIEPHVEEGYFYGGNLVQENWALNDPDKALQYRVLSENYAGLFIYPKSFKVTFSLDVIHTQFRGNRGFLASTGGPAVSLLQSNIQNNVPSRTVEDGIKSAERQKEQQTWRENRANKKMGKS